jgi:hypothetical protein
MGKNLKHYSEYLKEERLNEISGYGKDIWDKYKDDIFAFIKNINKGLFSGEDGALVSQELATIFKDIEKNEMKFDKFINEAMKRHRGDDDEELEPFTTSDGWDEDQLSDVGLIDLFDDIQRVIYEVKNARRGSYARFGNTGEDLGEHLIDLGNQLVSTGEDIIDNIRQ